MGNIEKIIKVIISTKLGITEFPEEFYLDETTITTKNDMVQQLFANEITALLSDPTSCSVLAFLQLDFKECYASLIKLTEYVPFTYFTETIENFYQSIGLFSEIITEILARPYYRPHLTSILRILLTSPEGTLMSSLENLETYIKTQLT